jgi:hypothetical protein
MAGPLLILIALCAAIMAYPVADTHHATPPHIDYFHGIHAVGINPNWPTHHLAGKLYVMLIHISMYAKNTRRTAPYNPIDWHNEQILNHEREHYNTPGNQLYVVYFG